MSLLDSIKGPEDVKQLNDTQLPVLASEIREKIIQTTSKNGGHIGPNLGVVELILHCIEYFRVLKMLFYLM